ncbi:hypothetical protein PsYK624_121010 [Phanerochaete sordida]|uniref:Uncharacterized protein n=1 Tax=Phanerochaete sordida TaxID=48140 RepID=A0A9P3GLW9_9APHY|nr:hypothetical protein PsYK624_121010 [Phanerochaete sordida]
MQVPRRFPTTSVRRLEVAYPPDLFPVLLRLHHQLDMAALREVQVDYCLDENLRALIASALALERLTYTTDGFIPPILNDPAALRSLELMCTIVVTMDPDVTRFRDFDLGKMILNAASLNASNLFELTLVISLSSDYRAVERTPSEDSFASALTRRLEDEDCQFEALARVMAKARRSLRRLKIVVVVDDPWKLNSLRYMVPYLACSAQVLRDVVLKFLGRDVERILEVTAEHRCEADIIVYYP